MRFDHVFGIAGICGLVFFAPFAAAQDAVRADDSVSADVAGKYPPGRNYTLERIEMIRAKQGSKRGNYEFESKWTAFRMSVAQIDGAWRYASEGSAVYRDFAAKQGAESTHSTYDILESVAKIGTRYDADLDAEGQRIIDQFLRTSTPTLLDSMFGPMPVVPDAHLERPAIMHPHPALGDARTASHFNVARMSLANRRGDGKEFLRAALHNMYIAHAVSCDSSLTALLTSIAIEQHTFGRIVDEQLAKPLSRETLAGTLAMLDQLPPANWETSIEGERLMLLDSIDWVYETGRFEIFEATRPQSSPLEKAGDFAKRMMWAPREAALAELDRTYAFIEKVMDPDLAVANKAEEDCRALKALMYHDKEYQRKYVIIVRLIPAFDHMARLEKQSRCARGGLTLFLAAEHFKIDKGRLPDSAGELVPNYLRSVPIDWFSKTREPLRYRKVDPKTDPLGRGFLVYSVGLDNTDDGGTIDPKYNNRAISSGENWGKGYDYVINWTDQLPDRK